MMKKGGGELDIDKLINSMPLDNPLRIDNQDYTTDHKVSNDLQKSLMCNGKILERINKLEVKVDQLILLLEKMEHNIGKNNVNSANNKSETDHADCGKFIETLIELTTKLSGLESKFVKFDLENKARQDIEDKMSQTFSMKGCNVDDYAITSESLLSSVNYFIVNTPSYLSDHNEIITHLKCDGKPPNINNKNKKSDFEFKWTNTSKLLLENKFKEKYIYEELNNFQQTNFENTQDGLNRATDFISDIYINLSHKSMRKRYFKRKEKNT
ncbi:unnamed protein product [Mytilus coruscus]|uniref:Uncharacterized protein n=1 Tax=Mytilus coruscus TaxID=42192 RepID=A0A6J8AA94_MYTCO|nr:unnamed protein product [Mytilus coruscus]